MHIQTKQLPISLVPKQLITALRIAPLEAPRTKVHAASRNRGPNVELYGRRDFRRPRSCVADLHRPVDGALPRAPRIMGLHGPGVLGGYWKRAEKQNDRKEECVARALPG